MTDAANEDATSGVHGPAAAPLAGITRTIRRLGIGAASIAAIVAILLIMAGVRAHREVEIDMVGEAQTLTDLVADQTARFIESADLMLDRMRQLGEETNWNDPTQAARLAAELRRLRGFLPAVVRLGIWDADGRRHASTEDDLPNNLTVTDRAFFTEHRSRPDGSDDQPLTISGPLSSQVDGTSILVLSRRINRPDGGFAGVATLSVAPADLIRPPPSAGIRGDASLCWVREDDQQPLLADRGGHQTAGGPDHVIARRKVGAYPLLVEFRMSDRAVFERWMRVIRPHLVLGLVLLLGFGAGAWMLLRWNSAENKHRQTLSTLTHRLRRSNADLEESVAERTKALSEMVTQRDLLLKEVNHRLKNSLQLACALVQMQGQSVGTPELRHQLADTVARLQAIARVHDQLYQTEDVRRVEAAAYLRSLCADLAQSTLASQRFWRIDVNADMVDLPTDQAVPVGLIVNELVTNAMKHGQPTDPGDEGWMVEVGLARSDDGNIRLTVRDHGAGFPTDALKPTAGSLGMKLLNGLTRQLKASLTVENAEPGARFVVTFRPQSVN